MRFVSRLLILTVFFGFSCQDDDQPVPMLPGESGVYISNEGGFGFGNASLSWYDRDSGLVRADRFEEVNGTGIGDVLQSLAVAGDTAFLAVNNSNKIEVVSWPGLERLYTIQPLVSPRYFLPIGNGKALVSDLYANGIQVVDYRTGALEEFIPVSGWTEEMVWWGDRVAVAVKGTNRVYLIDPLSRAVADSLETAPDPSALAVDVEGSLWVLSAEGSALSLFPQGASEPDTVYFLQSSSASLYPRLALSPERDTLYCLFGDLYRVAVGEGDLQTFIPADGRNLYGLGVDPLTSEAYLCDAVDYQQRGWVYRYSPSGILIDSFLAGVIPNGVYFW